MEKRPEGILPAQLILATDIDDTLLGNPEALAKLNYWLILNRKRVFLVYLTGRHRKSALEVIWKEGLILPDILVTDVGARICFPPNYISDPFWHKHILAGWRPHRIAAAVRSLPMLVRQPVPALFRLSYFIQGNTGGKRIVEEVTNCLQQRGLRGKVVLSKGIYLDILPPHAGKGPALAYLQKKYNWDPCSILVCGDSGNDAEMLNLGFPAVLVGNASEEVKNKDWPPTVYLARSSYAAGIWEGLQQWNKALRPIERPS
ncbi:MAG: HAD family hydrolase [Thermanaeromonas sp.]|uniref:HAD family hydrolase n=1 Tax=Thermanaeromonas sp. TaxID=2003697 RepID=UPI00243D669A|nr:HAD family hydrolase [Thermanaeromonas sp.]MCG0279001.1 HAD family hydrolase [Thermanaeromonas sp.]